MEHNAFYSMGNMIVNSSHPNPSEVELRTAVGRIYYYVYHEILNWVVSDENLNTLYRDSEIKSTHKKLINVFYELTKQTQDLNYGKITRLLSAMHGFRCKADYHLEGMVDRALFDSILANLNDLKDTCMTYNHTLFSVVISEKPSIIGSIKTNSGNFEVRKKPTLRLLD